MRTEAKFYEFHHNHLLNAITVEIERIEGKPDLDDQDEMELDALDELYRRLVEIEDY